MTIINTIIAMIKLVLTLILHFMVIVLPFMFIDFYEIHIERRNAQASARCNDHIAILIWLSNTYLLDKYSTQEYYITVFASVNPERSFCRFLEYEK